MEESTAVRVIPFWDLVGKLCKFDEEDMKHFERYIAYDKNVVKQYDVIRSCRHDGTVVFSYELWFKAVDSILKQETYFIPLGDMPPNHMPKYVVGDATISSEYGIVDLPCGGFPGQKETICIPVSMCYTPL